MGPPSALSRRTRCAGGALALFAALAPGPASAWGRDGHQIVAAIALQYMTPRARAQADALRAAAGGESFVIASDWADRIRRQHPETARWHFVDIEVGAGPYNEARDCPKRACAAAKIGDFHAELGDTQLDPERRGVALKWLIHLLGDVHQPLHAADRHDRGGNDLRVFLNGRQKRLHEIWDVELVTLARGPRSDEAFAAALARAITADERSTWSRSGPADWADEAYGLAEQISCGMPPPSSDVPVIGPDYERIAEHAIDLQLQRAGVRLASVLNEALR